MRKKAQIISAIQGLKKELEIAEKELAVVSRPKHGDYGVTMTGSKRLFVNVDGELRVYNQMGREAVKGLEAYLRDVEPCEYTILGNVFEDANK